MAFVYVYFKQPTSSIILTAVIASKRFPFEMCSHVFIKLPFMNELLCTVCTLEGRVQVEFEMLSQERRVQELTNTETTVIRPIPRMYNQVLT